MAGHRMTGNLDQLSVAARNAVYRRDWHTVAACSRAILDHNRTSAEGHFLAGLAEKATNRNDASIAAFGRALELDPMRHDAAIELAQQLAGRQEHAAAAALVARYQSRLDASPVYLHMAGTVCASIGMPERAWPLFERAVSLQPGVPLFEANLAACAVFVGRVDEARALYRGLLERFPTHQRYHYQLSRLEAARDDTHVRQMRQVLDASAAPPEHNVFMYYALGKELEDLERWDEAFDCFRRAGDAVTSVADYDVADDTDLVDTIIETCGRDWLASGDAFGPSAFAPVFLVGLPRSGTTLVDRILSSHSSVASVGETQYLPMVIREASGLESDRKMIPAMIRAAARVSPDAIRQGYFDRLGFRLGSRPVFVDKLPFNVLYLGFIARAFPDARLLLLRRNPMDACFAMYKQVFTGAYKFSYSQETLGRFYLAYHRLVDHWLDVLGERLVVLDYDDLVAAPEAETRRLLKALGLDFEPACLASDRNATATATASAVQVREAVHQRSVNRWRRYERQLAPLRGLLESNGVTVQ